MRNRLGILVFLLFILSICLLFATDKIRILSFDQNPAGSDKGSEWVMLYNSGDKQVVLDGWAFHTNLGGGRDYPIKKAEIQPKGCWTYIHKTGWLRNEDEQIILKDKQGKEIDKTPVSSDNDNDNRFWIRGRGDLSGSPEGKRNVSPDKSPKADWIFLLQNLPRGHVTAAQAEGRERYVSPDKGWWGLMLLSLILLRAKNSRNTWQTSVLIKR